MKMFLWTLLVSVFLITGCAANSAQLKQTDFDFSKAKVVLQKRPECADVRKGEVEDKVTGIDYDGVKLSYWTTSLKAVQQAYEEAVQMCGAIPSEAMTVTYPDYRCQIRVDFAINTSTCNFPK